MKYIKKINIDFDNWEQLDNLEQLDNWDENYVLNNLDIKSKTRYLIFKKFLLEYNILNTFFNNLLNKKISRFKNNNNNEIIIYFLKNTKITNYISFSFNWTRSVEKYAIWEFYNDMWLKYLKF